MNGKRLGFVSFFYPPDGGAGTQRAAGFARHLPEHGWDPVVFTREVPEQRGRWDPADPSLQPEGVEVVRSRQDGAVPQWAATIQPADVPLGFVGSLFDKLAARREDLEGVVITMSPFALSHVGDRVQRELGLKVVYDLRDPWALDGWRIYRNRSQWRRDRKRMGAVLARADGVVANTPDSRAAILKAFPKLDPERVAVITNGYTDDAVPAAAAPKGQRGEFFSIVHTGTLHSDNLYVHEGLKGWLRRFRRFRCEDLDASGRTARHLLNAVAILREREPEFGGRIRVVLAGVADEATRRSVRESGVEDCVELTGYVPHAESVRWLQQADALFLPLGGLPRGHRSRIVPGKVYEYIATGRPVLACLPEGDARDLVAAHSRCEVADPCDPEQIAAAILRLREGIPGTVGVDQEFLARYHRRALAGDMAAFCDQVFG